MDLAALEILSLEAPGSKDGFLTKARKGVAGAGASALDLVLPDALVYGVEANGGFVGAMGAGGQVVENYRTGDISLFGYSSASVGLQLGDASAHGGVIFNLEDNEDYAGGFHSVSGSAAVLGASIAVPGDSLIDGDDDGMSFTSGPWSITGSAGVSFFPVSGRVAESEYSAPITIPGAIPDPFSPAGMVMYGGHAVLRWLEALSQ
jgi:hypothetical protein